MDLDKDENIFVVDRNNHRIQKFTSDGNFVAKFGTRCDFPSNFGCVDPDGAGPLVLGDGQFSFPVGIALDSQDNVFVSDGNPRIEKFDTTGDYLSKLGSFGIEEGLFNSPQDVVSDNSGNIIVIDTNKNLVQKFDSAGNFLFSFGSFGTNDGEFSFPRGVSVFG